MSQSIAVVEEFLAQWRVRAKEYYNKMNAEYYLQRENKYDITEDNLKFLKVFTWDNKRKYTDEKVAQILAELPTMARYMQDNITSDIAYQKLERWKKIVGRGLADLVSRYDYDEYIEKFLDREVDSKRRKLISRVEKKVGEIIDASALYIGVNGEINGVVVGTKDKAYVNTIYAGGYAVQCLHYRVLVK